MLDLYDKVMELCRRRGILWSSFEIYGGLSGFVTYGPIGAILKRNVEDKWREWFVAKQRFVEIDSPVIMPQVVFKASGHADHFTDPMVGCLECKKQYRADHLIENATGKVVEGLSTEEFDRLIKENNITCPDCGGPLGKVDLFNLMFKTTIGPYRRNIGYARPEAAQGMFVDFKRVFSAKREQLPLGIAQIGRTFRNEISPRKGVIRLREFTIMEVEVFIDPDELALCPSLSDVEDEELTILTSDAQQKEGQAEIVTAREAVKKGIVASEWIAYFLVISKSFVSSLGVPSEKQRFREQLPWERAHYSKQTMDHQVLLERFGWSEVAGHAYRTDWDLGRHMKFSGADLSAFKRYDKPKTVKRTAIKPDVKAIRKGFGSATGEILSSLKEADPEIVRKAIKEDGFYSIGKNRIDSEHIAFDQKTEKVSGSRFVPHVIEPSFGADRVVYSVLESAYSEKEKRVILKLPPAIAPIQIAVFPLLEKDGLPEAASDIYDMLLEDGFRVELDVSGSIGRRYARSDEIGVPIAVTVDYQTLEDNTVTLRNRDSWVQLRNRIEDLNGLFGKFFKEKIEFEELGKPI
ncbi:MAG: glycine--tRNA ligase [Candidatus Hodarchaeota archaeon]